MKIMIVGGADFLGSPMVEHYAKIKNEEIYTNHRGKKIKDDAIRRNRSSLLLQQQASKNISDSKEEDAYEPRRLVARRLEHLPDETMNVQNAGKS